MFLNVSCILLLNLLWLCEYRTMEIRKVLFGSESLERLNQQLAQHSIKGIVRHQNDKDSDEVVDQMLKESFQNLQDKQFGEQEFENHKREIEERNNPNPLIPDTPLIEMSGADLDHLEKKRSLKKLGMQQYATDLISQGYLSPSVIIPKGLKGLIIQKESEAPAYLGMRSGLPEKQNIDGLANLVEAVQNQQYAFAMMKRGYYLPSQYPDIKPPVDFERPLLKMIQHTSSHEKERLLEEI